MITEFLEEAIRLSKEKMDANQGGPFGALVVRDGKIISKGWNKVTTDNDPTAHAEIVAIRAACQSLSTFSLEGCDIYCSCEPCPLCLSAIYWSRISTIYYAASSQDAANAGFDDRMLYDEICRPKHQRSIPMLQSLQTEAAAILGQWLLKPDRIPY